MSGLTLIGLLAGVLFGAGLAVSGMADPSRVRAFLDVGGAFDPTLAFVMGGALLPMSLAWSVQRRLARPLLADEFDIPATTRLDGRIFAGAALFGIGWGIAGLCPGPAIAGLALEPKLAAIFVAAMAGGMALHRLTAKSIESRSQPTEEELQMQNMGTTDRAIRLTLVAAIAIAYALGYLAGPLALVLGIVALAFLVTSVVGTCPAYLPFGFSTRPRD